MKKIFIHIICLLALFTGNSAMAEITVTFGAYTTDKPTTIIKQFQPILSQLEARMSAILGEKVSIPLDISSSYEQGRNKLISGEVDLARFGPASYVLTKEEAPGISILAVETHDGAKVFNGIIAVHADSEIATLEQLKNKRFAFGNQDSTIGRYLSQHHLTAHGIHAKDLASFDYLGRHDKVGAAVAVGQYDAGALKENTFNKQVKQGKPLRRIFVFPTPSKPWLARAGLPKRVADALRKALLEFNDPAALKALKCDGFTSGSDSDYETIRAALHRNPEFFQ